MQLGNSKTRYGAAPQAFHWLTAICVIIGWLLGQFMDAFAKGPPRDSALFAHMLLGQMVLLLLVARLAWRAIDPPPLPEPTRFGQWLPIAAKFVHAVLYVLLVAVPVLGIIVQLKRGNHLPVFGLFDVTSPWPADRATARNVLRAHGLGANALLIIAGLHALAALIHHYVFGNRTLRRMLPRQLRGEPDVSL